MKQVSKCLSAAALAAALLAVLPAAWAESQVPDPGAFGIPVNPTAPGARASGLVTLSYDYDYNDDHGCDSLRWVENLYVVATMRRGKTIQPFSSNYELAQVTTPGFPNLADCFDNQEKQLFFLKYVIEQVIVPAMFTCTYPSCPPWQIRSIKNFLTTGVGAASMEIVLAVQVPRRRDDDEDDDNRK
jgi:hypothetical protein